MPGLFLSPHNDDETLFGAFTLLAHRPKVIVVLRSFRQNELHGFDSSWAERERETDAAMKVLGVTWNQWGHTDVEPDWERVEADLRDVRLGPGARVWAPAPEDEGNPQHNEIGEIAARVFPGNVTHYMTYTNGRGRSAGTPVKYKNEWVAWKLCALSCYASQIRLESTCHHFMQPLHEFTA